MDPETLLLGCFAGIFFPNSDSLEGFNSGKKEEESVHMSPQGGPALAHAVALTAVLLCNRAATATCAQAVWRRQLRILSNPDRRQNPSEALI